MLPVSNPFVHGSTLTRVAAVRLVGGYNNDFPVAQDCDLWFRIAPLGTLANLPEILYSLRLHDESTSVQDRVASFREAIDVRQTAMRRVALPSISGAAPPTESRYFIPRPTRACEAQTRLSWAIALHGMQCTPDALRHGLAAALLAPNRVRTWRFLARVCLIAVGARRVKHVLIQVPQTASIARDRLRS
jgi:hypothetical protein